MQFKNLVKCKLYKLKGFHVQCTQMCCEHLGFEVFAACFAPCCSPVACEEGVDIEAGLEAGVLGEGEQAGPGLTRQLDPLT